MCFVHTRQTGGLWSIRLWVPALGAASGARFGCPGQLSIRLWVPALGALAGCPSGWQLWVPWPASCPAFEGSRQSASCHSQHLPAARSAFHHTSLHLQNASPRIHSMHLPTAHSAAWFAVHARASCRHACRLQASAQLLPYALHSCLSLHSRTCTCRLQTWASRASCLHWRRSCCGSSGAHRRSTRSSCHMTPSPTCPTPASSTHSSSSRTHAACTPRSHAAAACSRATAACSLRPAGAPRMTCLGPQSTMPLAAAACAAPSSPATHAQQVMHACRAYAQGSQGGRGNKASLVPPAWRPGTGWMLGAGSRLGPSPAAAASWESVRARAGARRRHVRVQACPAMRAAKGGPGRPMRAQARRVHCSRASRLRGCTPTRCARRFWPG